MSTTFSGQLSVRIGWNWVDSGGPTDNAALRYAEAFADGNDPNEAEAIWHLENQTILDGASDTHDLTALAKAVFDDTLYINFLSVKAIVIVNLGDEVTDGMLIVGGAASDTWSEPFGSDTDTVKVPIDSPLVLANRRCGWEVDDNNKNLKITASGGDATYSIAIIGTTTTATGDCSSSGL